MSWTRTHSCAVIITATIIALAGAARLVAQAPSSGPLR